MATTRFLLGTCVLAGALLWTSCSNENDTPLPEEPSATVPKQVLSEFESLFPGATDVVWTMKAEHAVADFYWDGSRSANVTNHTAWFALVGGTLDMTEKDIRFTDLPEKVKIAFESTEYAQLPWIVSDEVDVILRNDASETLYVIDVEKKEGGAETDVDLYYTGDGILVKKIIDADDDKDYQEYLPQAPSSSVESWLSGKYPGARIIDLDNEDGRTEIEFVFEGLKYEAVFDRSQIWMYTKTEYRFRNIEEVKDIPLVVLQALKSMPEYVEANGFIDDAEKYETSKSGIFYCFELESRFSDDIKIYIDDAGNILQSRPDLGGESSGSGGITVGEDLEAFIQSQYQGAVVLERDYDDGYLEITIRHEGKKKEVLFNGKNEWIRTSWDIRFNELPSEVLKALEVEGYSQDDDEAEVVEDANALWYEIEVRKGREEYKVFIDSAGNILKEIRD